jgi:hypothetical protein
MPRHTFKQEFLISICCSLVVALVLACNGTKATRVIASSTKNLASKLAVGTFSHIIPASNNAPLFASMFQTSQTPSQVPESFQYTCAFDVGSGFLASLQPGQIVPMLGNLNTFPNNDCEVAFTAPQAPQVFWTAQSLDGDAVYDVEPIFTAGTIQTMVVTALTSSRQVLRCSDLSDTAPVADGDVVLAYLDPQANTVTLYDSTSSLGVSCQLSGFPSGDTYLLLSVRFAKV